MSEQGELTHIRTLIEMLVEESRIQRAKLDEIAELDKKIVKVQSLQHANLMTIDTLHQRIDSLSETNTELESFVNKVKGALVLIGFFQAALIGGATWIVTQVVDTRQDVAVLQYTVNKQEDRDQPYRAGPLIVPDKTR